MMALQELLEKNLKGVRDLLHHEVSAFALAHSLSLLPGSEVVLKEIESKLYKHVVNIVQDIFQQLLTSIDLEETLQYDTQQVRQTIQLFVNEQVKETCLQLHQKIQWWKKKQNEA